MKLPEPIILYIEEELRAYDESLKMIEELKEDIILSSVYSEDAVQENRISNTVLDRVSQIMSSRSILRLQKTAAAIERGFRRLSESHRRLYEAYYLRGLDWQKSCDELHISRPTFYRLRNQLIAAVAAELGLMWHVDR